MELDRYEQALLDEVQTALAESWDGYTSAHERWTPENPALGQAAVSACVVQDFFGGHIYSQSVALPNGNRHMHYLNVLDNGSQIDTTRQQYPEGSDFGPAGPRRHTFASTREYLMDLPDLIYRYGALRQSVAVAMQTPDAPGIMDK